MNLGYNQLWNAPSKQIEASWILQDVRGEIAWQNSAGLSSIGRPEELGQEIQTALLDNSLTSLQARTRQSCRAFSVPGRAAEIMRAA
jgi:hypothetical protein